MTTYVQGSLTILNALSFKMPHHLTPVDQQQLEEVYEASVEDLDNPESLFTYTLANAMRRHFSGDTVQSHIYLQRFEIPQIRLFELLIQQFPLANLSQHCTNTLLTEALAQHCYPVLMDIGIGTGMQVKHIIEALSKKADNRIRTLYMVGIEPFEEAIITAHQNMTQVSSEVSFEVKFVSKVAFIEQLTQADLAQMLPAQYDGFYVNASFALHHIQQHAQRKKVFEMLKDLGVNALVLSEPNADHYEPDYGKRFAHCVNHYGALFRIIDTLDITPTEKAALKLFFSREIDDVLGHAENVRVEKHYATSQWEALFAETGYQLQKRIANFDYTQLNGTQLQTDLPDRYATTFEGEEITNLFWGVPAK